MELDFLDTVWDWLIPIIGYHTAMEAKNISIALLGGFICSVFSMLWFGNKILKMKYSDDLKETSAFFVPEVGIIMARSKNIFEWIDGVVGALLIKYHPKFKVQSPRKLRRTKTFIYISLVLLFVLAIIVLLDSLSVIGVDTNGRHFDFPRTRLPGV